MEIEPHPGQHPALLSPGTQVGAWRVVGWAGRGVYSAVYRAVPVGDALAPEAALKIALLPEDPRFAQEAELLGRMSHPSIPRLLDQGMWHSPGGTRHPFLVMERVDGVPLLVTGEYPEFAAPRQDESGRWLLDTVMLPAALMQGLGMEPQLRALILRMLSVRPEERGPTAQLAEELEQAAELAEARASVPQQAVAQVPKAESAARAGAAAKSFTPRAHAWRVWPWLALAAVGLALGVWTWRTAPSQPGEEPSVAEAEAGGEGAPEAEPTGLGEQAAVATSLEEVPQASLPEAMAEDTPPEPQPGQVRPDANGRCPRKRHVALNGGCWVEMSNREECEEIGYVFKGKCYAPARPRGRQPTSSPKSPR